jgi:hypothetical protein
VTHSGGGPRAFVASQSGGNGGGIALSKFSLNTIGKEQGGEQEGAGIGVALTAVEMSTWSKPLFTGKVDSPLRCAIARDELITPVRATTVTTKRTR